MAHPRSWISRDTAEQIVGKIANDLGLSIDDILGEDQGRRISHARQCAYLALRAAGASFPCIARWMQRDTQTVQYGVKRARYRQSISS